MANEDGDRYLLQENSTEVERLELQHKSLTEAAGTLVFAPVRLDDRPLRILDRATANGRWLLDLQASSPRDHTYIGTDLNTHFFPSSLPPGITLHQQSFTKPWPKDWLHTFDYVHMRLALSFCGSTPVKQVVTNMTQLLAPGGWIEFVETDYRNRYDKPLNEETSALAQLFTLAKRAHVAGGAGVEFLSDLQSWLEAAGLEEVQNCSFQALKGAGASNPKTGAISAKVARHSAESMIPVAKAMPRETFTTEELQSLEDLPTRVDKELRHSAHYVTMVGIWGRKPV